MYASAKMQKKGRRGHNIERISQILFEMTAGHLRVAQVGLPGCTLKRNQANCSEFTVLGFCWQHEADWFQPSYPLIPAFLFYLKVAGRLIINGLKLEILSEFTFIKVN